MTQEPLQLRPMDVGDLLDTTFRLYRRHFWLFIGIVAVIQIPLTLFEVTYQVAFSPAERLQAVAEDTGSFWGLYSTPGAYYADVWRWMWSQVFLFLLTFFAVQGLMNGAMARAVYDRFLGRPLGLVDTYRALGWRWLRLIWALIALGLLDAGIMLLLLVPCLGWVAAFVLLIYFNVPILSLLAPVVVIEDQGVSAGLGRAFALGRRKFWRVLGINVLLLLLTSVITVALPLLFGVALTFWEPGFTLRTVSTALLELVVTVIVRPVWVCGLTLLYFDLRMRLEGFDLELLVAQAESTVGV
jgi:hypothetical protein